MGLSCNFHQFLTMLIKLTNSSINDPESNKLQMIMNTDSTATLRFIKKLTVAKDFSNNKLKQQEFEQRQQTIFQLAHDPWCACRHAEAW